ncbi:S9 family peptidase [Mucilaginibacter dorajii]|uniref:S9 family peptidase n=1 Tax=Mucilaginibacter dorajii TaxID=692994 RepID=A0ABP7P1I6_9SPHI|nr:alpha/beta fold hydrolase [Mucilaginibacter dorajii]MCS3735527.1 dipeptidyl aminopeptidase/acylaminoacyl peptidase [Mucilaginibacter dorajii]
MKKQYFILIFLLISGMASAQNLTPELLLKIGRVSGKGISKDGKYVIFSVGMPNVAENKIDTKTYRIAITGGRATAITNADELLADTKISPDGKYKISSKEVKVKKVAGSDFYPLLKKSEAVIYDSLNYRHWDTWEDGKFGHVMLSHMLKGKPGKPKDLMPDEPYDCPLKPDGGDEGYVWSSDSKRVIYTCKKKFGTAYAISTNTNIYAYDIATGVTTNLTADNEGYDLQPTFNQHNQMAWLQMKRDGYESDKQDLVVANGDVKMNLTAQRDDIHVAGYKWAADGKGLFFTAPINGTEQLFHVTYPGLAKMMPLITQVTNGDFDINDIIGQKGNTLIVTRGDFNHANELYTVDITNGNMKQLSHVNDALYAKTGMCTSERRMVKTVDGKDMLVWVVYPPGFDKTKKYPALLFCEGGPQSALTQFYSFRWNLHLMASNGYIVVAPNRRGMPGHGTQWNEEISKDHGGLAMQDYLSAIDNISQESFVDKARLGCVGASYGGYSVYMLAGMHQKRFKTFIAHDGIFDFRSMYGTTEEVWFPNWDYGGPYWDKNNAAAQKSYKEFSPGNFVANWDTPILIYHGEKDFRVPLEQGLQAFQAAQLRGIKSRLIVMHDENHWVLHPQNALVWQHEFFKWLKETM